MNEIQERIMQASKKGIKSVQVMEKQQLQEGMQHIDDKTKYRRQYMENVIHVGPDYRM